MTRQTDDHKSNPTRNPFASSFSSFHLTTSLAHSKRFHSRRHKEPPLIRCQALRSEPDSPALEPFSLGSHSTYSQLGNLLISNTQQQRRRNNKLYLFRLVPVIDKQSSSSTPNIVDHKRPEQVITTTTTTTIINIINMAPQKPRCNFKECKSAAQRIVGDCGFCDGHFCAKHRLLEDHKCSGLEDCKKESHERNAAQLEAERTQVIRGV
ncbi:hypothetical protein F4815DRAFT_171403 [Daldinia loculata]|nr:hypothetical protein F4815DRAFT_171403 [Daldinia loculata]